MERYPRPGLQIREALSEYHQSVLGALSRERGASTVGFSAQSLTFENTGGLLRACGVQNLCGPDDLKPAARRAATEQRSSFGVDDTVLLDKPLRVLSDLKPPYAAMYLTLSSHYPYGYPNKRTGTSSIE